MPYFKYTEDGKSVIVDGKKYSVAAFRKQFDTQEFAGLTPDRKKGMAPKKINAPEVKNINSNPSPGRTRIGTLGAGRGGVSSLGGGLMDVNK